MLLFKSILETDKAAPRPDEQRKLPRYPVGTGFPFKTKLTLFDKSNGDKAKDWSVTPVNLSATGASIQLSLAAVAYEGEYCRMKFSLGTYLLEIPATIAHYRCYSQYSLCGIAFNFSNSEVQQAYHQLLEPVVIGNSLAPVKAVQDTSDRHKEQFAGDGDKIMLSVWRDRPEGQILSFDLRMHNYGVRWTEGSPELDVYGLAEINLAKTAMIDSSLVPLSDQQNEDVRWLFCLAVPNLAKAVPQDIREFLSALVA